VQPSDTIRRSAQPTRRDARRLPDPDRAARAPRNPARAGLILGRYSLQSRLGKGGFGEVWRAHDEHLRRDVALKLIPGAGGGDDDRAARAAREASAAARLNHPAIVALYEASIEGDDAYLVSELVDGETLAALERAGALSDRDVARVGIALCEALEHAHAHGVVHRDVKPQNVLIPTAADAPSPAKLTDFGVAQLIGDDPLTRTGDVLGTLAYMAPEQAEGRPVDARADLYSLGLVLYEALAGEHPVRARSPAASLRRLGAPLVPLRRRRRGLPPELTAAIDTAVAPSPGRRGSLGDLHAALGQSLGELRDEDGVVAPSPLERAVGTSRTRIAERVVGAAAGAMLGIAAVVLLTPRPPLAVTTAAVVLAVGLLVAPRAAWAIVAVAALAWIALAHGGSPGTATVLAAGLLAVPLLLARAGWLWSFPAAGPALGLLGVCAAAPALAGMLPQWRRRVALGALSWWWLALAEPISGRVLASGAPGDVAPLSHWHGSPGLAVTHVLWPIVTSGSLLIGIVWGLAAGLMPVLVRRRSIAVALAGAAVWALGLVLATEALDRVLDLAQPRGLLAGAAAGALAAAALAILRPAAAHVPIVADGLLARPGAEPFA